jgi:HEAT repeat protein
MEAVAAFPSEQAVPVLDLLLDSPDIDDVQHAAALLGNLGGESAVNSLKRLFSRSEPEVRKSAVRALLRVNSPSAREALERHRPQESDENIRALMSPMGT